MRRSFDGEFELASASELAHVELLPLKGMAARARNHVEDLRGVGRLAVDATKGITDLVEAMHVAIGGRPARLLGAPVYASIRGITGLVGGTLDVALSQVAQRIDESTPGPEREALLAALNGVLGDHLFETKNPLAIEMCLHRTESAAPTRKLLVLVHGLSMNRQAWEAAHDLGYTPVLLDYNSGLHISTNGRAFAAMLEGLVAEWPVPVETIAIVAHSMGGLLTRSACHYAEDSKYTWRHKLQAIVFVSTPHHGAPLERGGNWLETLVQVTRYSAPFAKLGKIRSAGVTDLRFGNVIDEHWQGRDRFERGADARTPVPLPRGVDCYIVAAEKDALVPLASAFGEHPNPELSLTFPAAHRFIALGSGHIAVLRRSDVWHQIERWLLRSER